MNFYDIEVETLRGKKMKLEVYRGRVLLIVNTASRDSFTPQYEGLEKLHRELGDRGLTVLGFPCDQLSRGEPGNAAEIESFVKTKYGVTFPMHAKVEVTDRGAHELYRFLGASKKSDLGDVEVRDNFEKFVVDRAGKVVARFDGRTTPDKIKKAIEKLL